MRPKNRKGKRWYKFAQSPRYEESLLFREHLLAARQILGDQKLPKGLAKEKYVAKNVDRLSRYDEYFQKLIGEYQERLNETDKELLKNTTPIGQLELNAEIFLLSEQVWQALLNETKRNPKALLGLNPRGFEELIAFLFSQFGYEVELTKKTRDGGRDVVAIRKSEVGVKYLIECKHPITNAKIGISPVRELYAVKVDEGATKAILATTSYFTKDAAFFMERHRWELELRDYDGVMEWVKHYFNVSGQE